MTNKIPNSLAILMVLLSIMLFFTFGVLGENEPTLPLTVTNSIWNQNFPILNLTVHGFPSNLLNHEFTMSIGLENGLQLDPYTGYDTITLLETTREKTFPATSPFLLKMDPTEITKDKSITFKFRFPESPTDDGFKLYFTLSLMTVKIGTTVNPILPITITSLTDPSLTFTTDYQLTAQNPSLLANNENQPIVVLECPEDQVSLSPTCPFHISLLSPTIDLNFKYQLKPSLIQFYKEFKGTDRALIAPKDHSAHPSESYKCDVFDTNPTPTQIGSITLELETHHIFGPSLLLPFGPFTVEIPAGTSVVIKCDGLQFSQQSQLPDDFFDPTIWSLYPYSETPIYSSTMPISSVSTEPTATHFEEQEVKMELKARSAGILEGGDHVTFQIDLPPKISHPLYHDRPITSWSFRSIFHHSDREELEMDAVEKNKVITIMEPSIAKPETVYRAQHDFPVMVPNGSLMKNKPFIIDACCTGPNDGPDWDLNDLQRIKLEVRTIWKKYPSDRLSFGFEFSPADAPYLILKFSFRIVAGYPLGLKMGAGYAWSQTPLPPQGQGEKMKNNFQPFIRFALSSALLNRPYVLAKEHSYSQRTTGWNRIAWESDADCKFFTELDSSPHFDPPQRISVPARLDPKLGLILDFDNTPEHSFGPKVHFFAMQCPGWQYTFTDDATMDDSIRWSFSPYEDQDRNQAIFYEKEEDLADLTYGFATMDPMSSTEYMHERNYNVYSEVQALTKSSDSAIFSWKIPADSRYGHHVAWTITSWRVQIKPDTKRYEKECKVLLEAVYEKEGSDTDDYHTITIPCSFAKIDDYLFKDMVIHWSPEASPSPFPEGNLKSLLLSIKVPISSDSSSYPFENNFILSPNVPFNPSIEKQAPEFVSHGSTSDRLAYRVFKDMEVQLNRLRGINEGFFGFEIDLIENTGIPKFTQDMVLFINNTVIPHSEQRTTPLVPLSGEISKECKVSGPNDTILGTFTPQWNKQWGIIFPFSTIQPPLPDFEKEKDIKILCPGWGFEANFKPDDDSPALFKKYSSIWTLEPLDNDHFPTRNLDFFSPSYLARRIGSYVNGATTPSLPDPPSPQGHLVIDSMSPITHSSSNIVLSYINLPLNPSASFTFKTVINGAELNKGDGVTHTVRLNQRCETKKTTLQSSFLVLEDDNYYPSQTFDPQQQDDHQETSSLLILPPGDVVGSNSTINVNSTQLQWGSCNDGFVPTHRSLLLTIFVDSISGFLSDDQIPFISIPSGSYVERLESKDPVEHKIEKEVNIDFANRFAHKPILMTYHSVPKSQLKRFVTDQSPHPEKTMHKFTISIANMTHTMNGMLVLTSNATSSSPPGLFFERLGDPTSDPNLPCEVRLSTKKNPIAILATRDDKGTVLTFNLTKSGITLNDDITLHCPSVVIHPTISAYSRPLSWQLTTNSLFAQSWIMKSIKDGESRKSHTLLIVVIILILLAAVGAAIFFVKRYRDKKQSQQYSTGLLDEQLTYSEGYAEF